jgi:hypothetical protein
MVIQYNLFDREVYQDVATIEIEKDRYNTVHLQIVGNEYMYGQNYIYEPIYYNTPLIYNSFGPIITDRMYQTGYYPSYYYAWNPVPIQKQYSS